MHHQSPDETASAGADGLIEREILNLDHQDALDALGTPSSHFMDALSEVDEDWRTLGHDAAGWIETALLFQRARERPVPAGDGAETPFRYSYSTQQRHTLVPLEAFFAHCREAIDTAPTSHRTRSVQTYPLAFRRRMALSRHGRGLQTHLRYGDPFLSGVYDIALLSGHVLLSLQCEGLRLTRHKRYPEASRSVHKQLRPTASLAGRVLALAGTACQRFRQTFCRWGILPL